MAGPGCCGVKSHKDILSQKKIATKNFKVHIRECEIKFLAWKNVKADTKKLLQQQEVKYNKILRNTYKV